jgi:hypothetical protein
MIYRLGLFALLVLLAGLQAFATTFSNRPLGAVVGESAHIIRGKAGTSQSDWGKGEAHGSIFTYTDVEITEVLKGEGGDVARGSKITIKQPGGERDGVAMTVAATAVFQPGEDVVVTLTPKDGADEAYLVLNLTAGKYNVVEEGGTTYVVNSLGAGSVYDPAAGKDAHGVSYNSKFPLEVFRKVARGEDPQAAAQKQFAPAPPGSAPAGAPAGHAHGGAPVATAPTPAAGEVSPAESVPGESGLSPWLYFAGAAAAAALILFFILRGRKKGGPP